MRYTKLRHIISAILLTLHTVCIYSQDTISIALVGDIMPATTLHEGYLPSHNGQYLFSDAQQVFQQHNIIVGNLETTIADSGTPRKANRDYMFLTPTIYANVLKQAGFTYLSLANNHTNDFGQAGILSTIQSLDKVGIVSGGLRQQAPYQIIKVKNTKIAICSFGFNYHCNPINDSTRIVNIITQAKQNANIVVVSFHGGAEGSEHKNLPHHQETYLGEKRGNLRQFAHLCIDNGADIVFGHGPHVVRAIEMYNNHIIAYSLGNFCTPYGISTEGIKAYAPILSLQLSTQGDFIQGRVYSLIQHRGIGPRFDSQQRALKEIIALSDNNISNGAINITPTGHIIPNPMYNKNQQDEESVENYNENDIDWSITGWE